jgi:hypothetical protein
MEGSGSIPIITDPDPGGLKTARAGRQQEQGDTKSRATARSGQQQEQGDNLSCGTLTTFYGSGSDF